MILLFLLLGFSVAAYEPVPVYSNNKIIILHVPKDYVETFVDLCLEEGVSIEVVYKVISYESKWDPYAQNKNKNSIDLGIMQLNDRYLDEFSWRYNDGEGINPFCWETNMKVGIKHLATLYKATGTWYDAVAAYNMGLTGYRERIRKKENLPAETQRYLIYVFGRLRA